MKIELTTIVPTSINKLYINQYGWNPKSRRREPTGGRILSQEGRRAKARIAGDVRAQLKGKDWDYEWTKEGYLYQDAVIYFARRGSDDNNIYKLLNDTLEGLVYDNDSRVLVRTQKIMYDTKNPRVELTLTPVEFVGIFDSQEEASEFESDCVSCSRYRKGSCSILQDLKRGTVREEVGDIRDPLCSKYRKRKTK